LRLREALRPLELRRLLSLGAELEESLSTRRDSVRAPDRLWVSDRVDRLRDPELGRLRDPELGRLRDPELVELERPRAFVLERFFEEELLEPPDLLPRRAFDPELLLRAATTSSLPPARGPCAPRW
jgi:hypothetical protein